MLKKLNLTALFLFLSACGLSAEMRIISLLPSNTEVLFALNAGTSVVGVTNYCDYPPQIEKVDKVGDFLHPNIERIVFLKPDLVLAGKWVSSRTVPRLREAGLQVVEIDLPNSLQKIYASIIHIASLIRKESEGAALVADLKMREAKIRKAAASRKKTPRIFIHIDNPNWTISKASFINDAMEACGTVNIYRDLTAAGANVSPESVVEEDPEVIVASEITAKELRRRPGWKRISAVKNGFIIDNLDKNTLNRPTPRLLQGMEKLSARLDSFGF